MPKGTRSRRGDPWSPYRRPKKVEPSTSLSPEIWALLPRDLFLVVAKFISGKALFAFINLSKWTRDQVGRLHMERFITERITVILRRVVYRTVSQNLTYKGEIVYRHNWNVDAASARREVATYLLFREASYIFNSPYSNPHLRVAIVKYLWTHYPHFYYYRRFDYLVPTLLPIILRGEKNDKRRDELLSSLILRCMTCKEKPGDEIEYHAKWPKQTSPLWEVMRTIRPGPTDRIETPPIDEEGYEDDGTVLYLKINDTYLRLLTQSRTIPVPRELFPQDVHLDSVFRHIKSEGYGL